MSRKSARRKAAAILGSARSEAKTEAARRNARQPRPNGRKVVKEQDAKDTKPETKLP